MGELRFGDWRSAVTAATFELYHLYSEQPGWDLEAEGLAMTGTGARPVLPGPSRLCVAYVDRPWCRPTRGALEVVELAPGCVRITGTLETDRGPLAIALDAALVT